MKTTNKNKRKSYTKVATGIYKTEYGMYRAQRSINGVRYSANFSNLNKAKAYYKNPR
jgi:hypothetical protein